MLLVKPVVERAIRSAFPVLNDKEIKGILAYCQKAEVGDIQCNNAMGVHKLLKDCQKEDPSLSIPTNPAAVAQAIVDNLETNDFLEPSSMSIAGPGFINMRFKDTYLASTLKEWLLQGRIPPPPVGKQRIAVDFSSPNLAKEMHVGHLRSTIIGECICRVLEYCGHDVLRINHVGDWGTQFGMLIAYLKHAHPDYEVERPPLKDLSNFYREAKKLFDKDPDFKARSQQEVVSLQHPDPAVNRVNRDIWKWLLDVSRAANNITYQRLNVTTHETGESYYNDMLPDIVQKLEDKGLVEVSGGAKVIWVFPKPEPQPEGDENKKKKEANTGKPPFMLVKSDGGFNYDSTDIAALYHRVNNLKCERLVYVVDAGQSVHFELLFGVARKAGWADGISLEHAKFGLVLGEEGGKMKTRSGDSVLLSDVMDQAVELAKQKSLELQKDGEEFEDTSEVVGISAIKYFDLNQNRTSDYKFDYPKMCSLQGNTAVYILYAYVRLRSMARKANQNTQLFADNLPAVGIPEERNLAVALLKFRDVVEQVHDDLFPNKLTEYLFSVSSLFSKFYDAVNVIKSEEPLRTQRVMLCECTALVFRVALGLLGIPTLEKM